MELWASWIGVPSVPGQARGYRKTALLKSLPLGLDHLVNDETDDVPRVCWPQTKVHAQAWASRNLRSRSISRSSIAGNLPG